MDAAFNPFAAFAAGGGPLKPKKGMSEKLWNVFLAVAFVSVVFICTLLFVRCLERFFGVKSVSGKKPRLISYTEVLTSVEEKKEK